MGTKKRQRSESFQAEPDDDGKARKRLEAFHARMFELLEDLSVIAPETLQKQLKTTKLKMKLAVGDNTDDEEAVPMVKLNVNKKKKEKKKKTVGLVVNVEEKKKEKKEKKMEKEEMKKGKKKTVGPAVKIEEEEKKEKKEKKKKEKKEKKMEKVGSVVKFEDEEKKEKKKVEIDQAIVSKTLATSKSHGIKEQNIVAPAIMNKTSKKKKKKNSIAPTVKKMTQWHSMQVDDVSNDDEVNLLEQALGSMKEIVNGKADISLHKKHNTVLEEPDAVSNVEKLKKKDVVIQTVADVNTRIEPPKKLSNNQKRKNRKLRKKAAEKVKDSNLAPDDFAVVVNEDETNVSDVTEHAGALSRENGSTAAKPTASSSKSRTKRKKSSKATTTKSLSAQTQAPAQPRQDKPLIVPETSEKLLVSNAAKYANEVAPKMAKRIDSKPAVPLSTKIVSYDENSTVASLNSSTLISTSLMKTATKKNDMHLSTQNELIEETALSQVTDKVLSESKDNGGSEFDHSYGDNTSLFSRLIDSAAREQWDLVEVGRLVRLFATEWDFEQHKTARFLCETCPELVNVDFLEGLDVDLSAKQLVQVFEAGSGNSRVLVNKIASAVENGHLSVRDPMFISALEQRVALMESNAEVMELLHPLLESLSTVRDVGCLLKQLCKYWQLERKIALVQQVLLSNVFDDLDGNQDEILLDLPDLTDRLDFPSRLDQEDVDENGNLKGFLVDDDSDASGEERSVQDLDEVDSEDDEGSYEEDTDSEEDVEISGRSRGRNQFIEDEVDVGDEDDETEEEERLDNVSASSDSDSMTC